MIDVASTFSKTSLSELQVKYFSRTMNDLVGEVKFHKDESLRPKSYTEGKIELDLMTLIRSKPNFGLRQKSKT